MKTQIISSRVSVLSVLSLSVALVLGACGKQKESAGEAANKTDVVKAEDKGHASADVVPGSHEDWCAEHAVPESQCTLCNPSLVAAFKATGDWCEEHGLPNSHDRKHNPDLKIERPAKK